MTDAQGPTPVEANSYLIHALRRLPVLAQEVSSLSSNVALAESDALPAVTDAILTGVRVH